MKYTLLQLTQEILSSMDSDEVNSITDTTESLQVSKIVRQTYFDLIDDLDPPEHYLPFELTASTNSTKPTLMTVPEDISKVSWIKYDSRKLHETAKYSLIGFLPKEEFLYRMHRLDTADSNIGAYQISTVDSSTIDIFYYKDRAPLVYTCMDDRTIIFDAFDNSMDTTLQKDKTMCYGKKIVTFDLLDNFIPDLDENSFQRLMNEAKELAFAELKSITHSVADRNAKRSRNRSFKNKVRVSGLSDFDQLPSFGRKATMRQQFIF